MDETVLFGRYRLLDRAGAGGTAHVWRALDERTGDEVAVKRLHPVVFATESGRRRLVDEFRALRGLRHPAIVRVRDLEVSQDEAALILDFVPGTSLRDRLAAGERPTPAEASRIVGDLAGALGAAHAAGLVHRDVSPGNVLIGTDGRARLTDFGIARASGDDATAVTQTGTVVGTLRYISPEQLRGDQATPRSDLYGLAAVTFEMLAGRPPFPATTPVSLVEAQQAGPPRIDGVPAAVDAVVRRGLALDPADRPASVGAFAADLDAAVNGRPARRSAAAAAGVAGAVGAAGVAGVAGSAGADAPVGSAPPRPGGGRATTDLPPASPVPIAAGAALALGALILVAAAIGGPDGSDVAAGAGSASPAVTATAEPEPMPEPTPTPRPRRGGGGGGGDDDD